MRGLTVQGTKEYWPWLETGIYGQLQIEKGKHARGNTLHIYVLAEPPKDTTEVVRKGRAEVFGITGGQPGWTETYGWLKDGPWVQDIERMVQEAKDRKGRALHEEAKQIEKRRNAEEEREQHILASYKSGVTTE